MFTILCIDDDRYLAELACYALEKAGFKVLLAHTGREALRLARSERIHLTVLDVTTPDLPGLAVLRGLRGLSPAPLIALSPSNRDEDVIACFDHGADDYLAKPFNVQILLGRIGALLRRAAPQPPRATADGQVYRITSSVFDAALNELIGPGVRIKLTPTECHILHLLFLHEGQLLSAHRILEHIWGRDGVASVQVVKTHIHHLRQKIATLPDHPQPIRTVKGGGYVVQQSDAAGVRATGAAGTVIRSSRI